MRKSVKIVVLVAAAALLTTCATRFRDGVFCERLVKAEVETVISVGGEQYTSKAIHIQAVPNLSMADCRHIKKYGEAHIFRLNNGRVVIRPVQICYAGGKRAEAGTDLDLTAHCRSTSMDPDYGWIVDNADNPRYWRPIREQDNIQIVSVTVRKAGFFTAPDDQIEQLAPGLLRSEFGVNPGETRSHIATIGTRTPDFIIRKAKKRAAVSTPKIQVKYGEFSL